MDRLMAMKVFCEVAATGSFTAAANALLISQSALSRHVISLERLIGVQLFERKPHALVLTPAGQHLLPAVTKSFDRLEYALDEIRHSGAPTERNDAFLGSLAEQPHHTLVTIEIVQRQPARLADARTGGVQELEEIGRAHV